MLWRTAFVQLIEVCTTLVIIYGFDRLRGCVQWCRALRSWWQEQRTTALPCRSVMLQTLLRNFVSHVHISSVLHATRHSHQMACQGLPQVYTQYSYVYSAPCSRSSLCTHTCLPIDADCQKHMQIYCTRGRILCFAINLGPNVCHACLRPAPTCILESLAAHMLWCMGHEYGA